MKQAANTEDLMALAKLALAETEEKQLAALDGVAQLPFGYGTQPGDTLDLSDKGVRVLPTELINLIRDRVERYKLDPFCSTTNTLLISSKALARTQSTY